jgi:hypothetical protein
MQVCDKCGTDIIDNHCFCGVWGEAKDIPVISPFEKAILQYNMMCKTHDCYTPISGDHHSGTSFIFFKGGYEDCEKVKEFMKTMGEGKK